MRTNAVTLFALLLATVASAVFFVGFTYQWFPLGVPGEFEYPRLGQWDVAVSPWKSMLPAAMVAAGMIAYVIWSLGWLETATRRTFFLAVAGVMLLGGSSQILLEIAAPSGLHKWSVLFHSFRYAARSEFSDVPAVLSDHAQVAASFEPNHISANPAGWIIVYRALLTFFDGHPAAADFVLKFEPDEVAWSLRALTGAESAAAADQAAVTIVAYLSRCAALLVGAPIAWLVTRRYGRSAAMVAVAMSMLVPAATLLAPGVDSVYPTFTAFIVAMSYHASSTRSWLAAALAGGLIAVGMIFSLCFLVVAALCALMVVVRHWQGHPPSLASVVAAPAAWALVILLVSVAGHRAWETWQVNLEKNHEFNRYCGCTYSVWVAVNLVEFAVAMGIPAAAFLLARIVGGFGEPRLWRSADAIFVSWTAVVAILSLAGINRAEVSRLWLFLMPLAAALSVESMNFSPKRVRAIVAGVLLLQAMSCLVLSRELVVLWQWLPHDVTQLLTQDDNREWVLWRRLSDEALERREGKPPTDAISAEKGRAIRPGQMVYLWSPRAKTVAGAADADAFSRLLQADNAHDVAALDELTRRGRVALYPNNVAAIVIKTGKKSHLVRLRNGRSGNAMHVAPDNVHPEKKD